MNTPFTDAWAFGDLNTEQSSSNSSSSDGGLDWLNSTLDSLGGTAVKVLDAKAKIDTISNQNKTQQMYENANQTASQPLGSKNLIGGIDNNILLVGAVGVIGAIMFLKG